MGVNIKSDFFSFSVSLFLSIIKVACALKFVVEFLNHEERSKVTFPSKIKGQSLRENHITYIRTVIPQLKVASFRKCDSFFKSQIHAHNSIVLWGGILNFKLRIVFWNMFFWRLGDLKNE